MLARSTSAWLFGVGKATFFKSFAEGKSTREGTAYSSSFVFSLGSWPAAVGAFSLGGSDTKGVVDVSACPAEGRSLLASVSDEPLVGV